MKFQEQEAEKSSVYELGTDKSACDILVKNCFFRYNADKPNCCVKFCNCQVKLRGGFAMRFVVLCLLAVLVPCFAGAASLETAVDFYNKGDMDAAIVELEAYVDENPVDTHGLYYLGYAYYEKGMMEKAVMFFRHSYLIDPNFTPVLPGEVPPSDSSE